MHNKHSIYNEAPPSSATAALTPPSAAPSAEGDCPISHKLSSIVNSCSGLCFLLVTWRFGKQAQQEWPRVCLRKSTDYFAFSPKTRNNYQAERGKSVQAHSCDPTPRHFSHPSRGTYRYPDMLPKLVCEKKDACYERGCQKCSPNIHARTSQNTGPEYTRSRALTAHTANHAQPTGRYLTKPPQVYITQEVSQNGRQTYRSSPPDQVAQAVADRALGLQRHHVRPPLEEYSLAVRQLQGFAKVPVSHMQTPRENISCTDTV